MSVTASHTPDVTIRDRECQLWARQLICDVKEYVEKEEKNEQAFVRAWFAWKELVRGLNLMDLRLYREDEVAKEEEILKSHGTLVTMAIHLGILIKNKSESIEPRVLSLASFTNASLDGMMHSLEDSHADFHSPRDSALEEELRSLLCA